MISKGFAEFLSRLRSGGADPKERARLAALLELSRALAEARDLDTLLRLLLDEAIALFEAERGFLIRGEGASWRVALARSLDRETVQQPRRKVSSTVIRECLEQRRGVFAEDAQEEDFGAAQSVADLKLRSVLCIPLLVGERVFGCVYLDHRFRSGVFQAADLPWFQAFADQGAIALHLHELLEEVRHHSERVEQENTVLARQVVEQARELTELQPSLTRGDLEHDYAGILGESPALLRHLRVLDRVVAGDYPVLLVGESGCGKELAARAIWRHGRRRDGAFVAVNVAALNPSLLESELFGHVRGAFTGADRDRVGLLREADGGVLFLDEVTEMPLETQVKLLRFLEDRQVRPVGGTETATVDLRIVAATNRDPLQVVADGAFRQDLYYRLAVVTVTLPPLRERRADVPQLVAHFLTEAARDRGAETPRTASPELLDALARRTWHGNLRQLRNEVFRLDALAHGDGPLGPEQLPPESAAATASRETSLDLAELERRTVQEALRVADGNKAEAARLLGISRRALYNKLARGGESG